MLIEEVVERSIEFRLRLHHIRAASIEAGGFGMKRLIFWASVISGVAAAYMMYKRGEPMGSIAKKTVTNPIGTLAHEVKEAF